MNEEGEEGRKGVGYSERVYCLSRGIFLFFSRSVCIIIAPVATTMGGQFLLGRHCICPVGNWMAVAGSGPSFRLDRTSGTDLIDEPYAPRGHIVFHSKPPWPRVLGGGTLDGDPIHASEHLNPKAYANRAAKWGSKRNGGSLTHSKST